MIYLTPTHMLEYLYCPRFSYYNHVLNIPERQEKRYKVQKGRDIHEIRKKVNTGYLRKKLGVVKKESDVELNCPDLQLRGKVDDLLYLDDGTMAPFDYKYAEFKQRLWKTFRVQETLYALMINHIYKVEVTRAILCFTRSKYKIVELELKEKDYLFAKVSLDNCLEIIQNGIYPEPTSARERCRDCAYKNICIQ